MTLSPKKKRAVVITALLVVAVVACPLVMLVKPGRPPDFSDSRSVYRWHGGRWTSVPALAGGTEELKVARQTEAKKQSRALWWQVPLFLIGAPYLLFAMAWGRMYLRGVRPGAPEWALWAVGLAPVVVLGAFLVGRWLRKRSKSGRLESAISMGDKMGSARVGIAESLLLQGKEPEKALALLEEAMKIKKSRQALPERMANKAWALALMGRQQEMQEAMATALREINPSLRPVAASAHWRIGKALVAVQRAAEAMDHFRTASQADPQGHNGALSRLELERHGALGG
jgi:tetratricopeptide (TPR) repeat protein